MREFNDFEKDIIKRIIALSKTTPFLFENIIAMYLINQNLEINIDNCTAKVIFDKSHYDENDYTVSTDAVRSTNYNIITILNVVNTLKDNGYLISYFETAPKTTGTIIYMSLSPNSGFFESQYHDKDVINSLISYYSKSFFCDAYLKDFVRRGFITKEEKREQEEEQRQKEDLKIAKNALVIAVILGGLDLIIGAIELCHSSHQVHLLEKLYHLFKWS